MSYRNKTYVIFDGDDINYYRMMQAWKSNDNIDFDFNDAHDVGGGIRSDSQEDTIKSHLRERFANSNQIIVLVGTNTKYKTKYVRWEIEVAIRLELPIVVVNLNKNRRIDDDLCPTLLKNYPAAHIGYYRDMIKHALDNWSDWYENNKQKASGWYYYEDADYRSVGINI